MHLTVVNTWFVYTFPKLPIFLIFVFNKQMFSLSQLKSFAIKVHTLTRLEQGVLHLTVGVICAVHSGVILGAEGKYVPLFYFK